MKPSRVLLAAFPLLLLAAPARGEVIEYTDRLVQLVGGVNTGSVSKVVREILKMDSESHDPIWLQIDSYGGSVDAGFILIDTIRSIESPVYGVVTSKAYSMGAIIAVFCKKRYIYPHATMMFHEASYGALGEDPSIRSRMEFNQKYLDRLHHEIAKIMGMPHDKYRSRIRDAWWVLAPEAKQNNMVDAVVTGIKYRPLHAETVEIKRTRTLKSQKLVRPGANGPQTRLDVRP